MRENMSKFEPAVEYVLEREGGLNENPNDLGGITNFGISLRFIREISLERLRRYGIFEPITDQTIRNLAVDQAKFIYKGEFWNEAPFHEIEYQEICNYVFDMCVNLGIYQGIKLLQRAIWASMRNRYVLKDDGILGSNTISEINLCNGGLLSILIAIRACFYAQIAALNPSQKINLEGWLNRAYEGVWEY